MADIEFVIEAPQAARPNKKRPRLVTSCDHCRVKKIKCVQQPATGKCESCVAANLPCLYRDREQYFAERTRMLSGAGSAVRDASSSASGKAQLSAINASTPTPSRGPTPPRVGSSSGRSSTSSDGSDSPSYYPYLGGIGPVDMISFPSCPEALGSRGGRSAWGDSTPPSSWTPQRHSPDIYRGHGQIHSGMAMTAPLPSNSPNSMQGLFDTQDSYQPNPAFMLHFIHDFFDRFASSYPFLSSNTICEQFLHRRLPPLLANAIAACAARYSSLPELLQIGPANAADVYCQIARNAIPRDGSPPSIDTLHALMLLAWAEHKRSRYTMFNAYARTCTRIAAELGISDESLPHLLRASNASVGRMLQATWQGIQLLERTLLATELIAFSGSQSTFPATTSGSSHSIPSSSLW